MNAEVDRAARSQGLRLVMPWSDSESGNIVDSQDTEAGVTPADVVRNVVPGLRAGAIVAMHDGEMASARLIAQAIPGIVDAMRAKHLARPWPSAPMPRAVCSPRPARILRAGHDPLATPRWDGLTTAGHTRRATSFRPVASLTYGSEG